MCGIIAVLRRRARRAPPAPSAVRALLTRAVAATPADAAVEGLAGRLDAAAVALSELDALLSGPPGVATLLDHAALDSELTTSLTELQSRVAAIEAALDGDRASLDTVTVESINAAMIRFKDAVFAILGDRLRHARAVRDLAGPAASASSREAYGSIQTALSALDRLEVRGRDSAGLHVYVTGHGLDVHAPSFAQAMAPRLANRLFTSTAVRVAGDVLSFVYKRSAEIGELGDNVRALREAIRDDEWLRRALQADTAQAAVLAHTRWASIGIISPPNAHPLNQEETDGGARANVVAVLNGDVDNHAELKTDAALAIADDITTDAKVIPVLVARRLDEGVEFVEAFRRTVASFVGSVAIAAATAAQPSLTAMALRGSGQALYVGFAEDAFVVASELYGLVEETPRYLRLDGETPGNPANPSASQGQVVVLDAAAAGTPEGVRRMAYDGTPLPLTDRDIGRAVITTRDIDRGDAPHFLLKEIGESPRSLRKTLRSRVVEVDGRLRARLGPETLPSQTVDALRSGRIRRIQVIGQGTAAVAGQGIAALLEPLLEGEGPSVQAQPATELSGFHLRDDMRDTLVVAVSQSGTTTDTNRTVDLLRARGATVVAIVNRRGSDLCDKSDGVLFTSDGRDVEMSVASTKAFYAQIAAGALLSAAIAGHVLGRAPRHEHDLLKGLRALPDAMTELLRRRESIAKIATAHAPTRRYWALVGNGRNRVAAQEVRIKLSELCYKSIACDATEDKKHIDLSSEPLVLVCAAGLVGSTADDVAKEVAIYRAHKALPIVVHDDGETRFTAAIATIAVPPVHQDLAFVMSTMAGHLFGYHAALAIDASARPLREARGAVEDLVGEAGGIGNLDAERMLIELQPTLAPAAGRFFQGLRERRYDGSLEAGTAVRLASLLRYATGTTPLESFEIEHGAHGTPIAVLAALTDALTRAIEELTRPVDAIKHQAKTVTVGISRSDEGLTTVPLVKAALATGVPRDHFGYRDLKTLAALDRAVAEVTGFTRYAIDLDAAEPTIRVVDAGGVAKTFASRTGKQPLLRGTKHLVATERQLLVARGRSDGRTVVLVPEVTAQRTVGLTLLHVRFHDRISADAMRGVLDGYRNRYAALRDAVTETEPTFRETLLGELPPAELLTIPVQQLADRWR